MKISGSIRALLVIAILFQRIGDSNSSSLEHKQLAKNMEMYSRNKRAAIFEDTSKKGFIQNEKRAILDKHNEYRSSIGAMDMIAMRWNSELEQVAQQYAEGCQYEHSGVTDVAGFGNIGENLYAADGVYDVKAVEKWFAEYQYYDYDNLACDSGKMCGHYTQVVWSLSHEVGCGVSFCPMLGVKDSPNKWYVVCNYAPAGNFPGQNPYSFDENVPHCMLCQPPFPDCNESYLCYDSTVENALSGGGTSTTVTTVTTGNGIGGVTASTGSERRSVTSSTGIERGSVTATTNRSVKGVADVTTTGPYNAVSSDHSQYNVFYIVFGSLCAFCEYHLA
ncbi:hypothetical protein ScPMuIL_010387 [Solemya velum]